MKFLLPSIFFLAVLVWIASYFTSHPAEKDPVKISENIRPGVDLTESRPPQISKNSASAVASTPRLDAAAPFVFPLNSPSLPASESLEGQPFPVLPATAKPSDVPLVWQDPSSDVEWSSQQLTAFKSLWNKFVDDVGGPDQNPSEPGYQERWNEAQRESDLSFKELFGRQAFNAHQFQQIGTNLKP